MPRELVVVGPAGTGKTYPILAVIHDLCKRYSLRVLLLRATRASLTESVLVTYEDEILARDGWRWLCDGAGRAHRLAYDYPSGSTVVPAGLDRTPSRVLSTSWDIVHINECIEVKQDVWEYLATRLNRPGRQRTGWLIGDTNPGSPEHWLKRRCDAGTATLWETSHEANPVMHDGRDWTPAGLSYLDTLNRLTGVRRKRLLDGQWVAGEGVWFDTFDPDVHVGEAAGYDPQLRAYLAIDTGVHTGAVWFQVRESGHDRMVSVFGDYYSYDFGATANARAIMGRSRELCGGRLDRVVADPAGRARTGNGPTVLGEYELAGFRRIDSWPLRTVNDSLELLATFVGGEGDNPPGLMVHPRCKDLINAFGGYMRAQQAGQWIDRPVDPQHPWEDTIDALRGGLCAIMPEGRRPQPAFTRYKAGRIF
jgi:Terminase-like family.